MTIPIEGRSAPAASTINGCTLDDDAFEAFRQTIFVGVESVMSIRMDMVCPSWPEWRVIWSGYIDCGHVSFGAIDRTGDLPRGSGVRRSVRPCLGK